MIAQNAFSAAGRAAMHCASLTAREMPEHALDDAFLRFATGLAQQLVECFQAILAIRTITPLQTRIETTTAAAFAAQTAKHCCNVFALGDGSDEVFTAIDAVPLAIQLERLLGGSDPTGDADKAPGFAVRVLLGHVEQAIRATIQARTGRSTSSDGQSRSAIAIERMMGVPPQTELLACHAEFAVPGGTSFAIAFAVRPLAARRLIHADQHQSRQIPVPESSLGLPQADIPLMIRAELARLSLPASRLAKLRPGDVLPIPISTAVPLLVGETQIALGSVGEHDDRLSLRIVQTSVAGAQ